MNDENNGYLLYVDHSEARAKMSRQRSQIFFWNTLYFYTINNDSDCLRFLNYALYELLEDRSVFMYV